jgi:CheY-like chemotaxis protein
LGVGKVLIVEDEMLIRIGIAADFHDGGYETVETGTANDALHILRTIYDIKVVFTDINMPGDMDAHMVIIVLDFWPSPLAKQPWRCCARISRTSFHPDGRRASTALNY